MHKSTFFHGQNKMTRIQSYTQTQIVPCSLPLSLLGLDAGVQESGALPGAWRWGSHM